MQIGEASYTPPTDPPVDPNDGKEHVNMRCGAFNDGTSNNRVNIQSRLDKTDKYLEKEAKHKKKQDSYESDFTNIAKMEPHVLLEPTQGYQHILKTYIEGPGTTDNEGDDMRGYGIGMGPTGIRAKVKKGILDVVTKVDKQLKENKKIVIDLLTLDLYGFSRGAAGARHFIHEALFGDHSIKQQLQDLGYTVGKVEVCFVGLYDTVSSHGLNFKNDVEALNLHAISRAKSVLHLVAADEIRENFALTNITSAGKIKGREISIPGVHSNVGGSYNDAVPEAHTLYAGSNVSATAQYRAQLIAGGWGTEEEITQDLTNEDSYVTLRVSRPAISNHYSKIPLHIMARAAREQGIVFKPNLDRKEKIPEELLAAQAQITAFIDSEQGKASTHSQTEYWRNNKEPWLRALRHKHLHFSARDEFGLKPRINKDGQRHRLTIDDT